MSKAPDDQPSWWQRFAAWMSPGKWVVAVASVNLLSTGIFVYASEAAREHNCALVEDALDAYTDGLVAGSEPDDGRSPAETAEIERRIAVLNQTYKPILNNCK